MDNYTKGRNVEPELTRDQIPLSGLPADCKWIKVKAGSKLRNLIGVADEAVKQEGAVVFSGHGPAVGKVVSIVEIVKRKNKGVFQYNEINNHTVEEHWDPKTEDLDPLKVVRDIPQMFVALTKTQLPDNSPQGSLADFLGVGDSQQQKAKRNQRRRQGSKKASEELGMNPGGEKKSRNNRNAKNKGSPPDTKGKGAALEKQESNT